MIDCTHFRGALIEKPGAFPGIGEANDLPARCAAKPGDEGGTEEPLEIENELGARRRSGPKKGFLSSRSNRGIHPVEKSPLHRHLDCHRGAAPIRD